MAPKVQAAAAQVFLMPLPHSSCQMRTSLCSISLDMFKNIQSSDITQQDKTQQDNNATR